MKIMDRKEYWREYSRGYLKDPENKKRHNYSTYKSHAKKFVANFATSEDMDELMMIFEERQGN